MEDDPIYGLPPDTRLSPAVTPLAEVVDPFNEFLGVAEMQKKNAGKIGSKPLIYAVLDTGVDAEHPDLKGQVLDAQDFSNSIWGPEDRNGHGSWCAGAIAAKADNFGIRGIAYEGKLVCAKVLGDNGSGTDSMITQGLKWAYTKKNADVYSFSLGGGRMSESLHSLFREVSQQKGKFIFAASGNDAGPVNYPAIWPELIAVGAVDAEGKLTQFTSRGPELDILAPGVEILSTVPGGRHATLTGTSMACPIAAAIGGLVYANAVNTGHLAELDSVEEMIALLKKTARDSGGSGKYPLIDPRKLSKEFDPLPPPPPPPGPGGMLPITMVFSNGEAWNITGVRAN